MDDEPEISWVRLAAFLRQHTHDLRNGLNCLDLETALLQEIVTDDEGRDAVTRMRRQVRQLAEELRRISTLFQDPQPFCAPLPAHELLLIWREQQEALPEPPAVEWIEEIDEEKVKADPEMMAAIFRELLVNARSFRDGEPAVASVRREGREVVFELREPKGSSVDTAGWGHRLFSTTKRGGYGLGLWSIRRMVEANGATITQRHTTGDADLSTRIAMPTV